MNPDAVLNMSGFPVKLSQFGDYRVANTGQLFSFSHIEKGYYEYYSKYNFLEKHVNYKNIGINGSEDITLPGYYKPGTFTDYLNGTITLARLKELVYGNTGFILADVGDIIEVAMLSPGYDGIDNNSFADYYRRVIYRFKYTDSMLAIFKSKSQFPPVNTDDNSPNYSVVEKEYINLSNYATGFFYATNFGQHVDNWQIPDKGEEEDLINYNYKHGEQGNPTKYQLAYAMTLICWEISHIIDDILPKIAVESIINIKDFYTHKIFSENPALGETPDPAKVSSFDNLAEIDKTVAVLLRDWGEIRLYNKNVVTIPFNPIFQTSVPDKSSILRYQNSLDLFYRNLWHKEESDIFPGSYSNAVETGRRMEYLLRVLPENAIATLPQTTLLGWLKHYNKSSEIAEDEQRIVVSIMLSFIGSANSDDILDFFLEKPDGTNTRFENIYTKLDDARTERYPIANWFVDYQTNRKFFVYALYEIWKTSKYNFFHIPNGVTPNEDEINPSNYWFTPAGSKYYPSYDVNGSLISGGEPVLEFDMTKYVDVNTSALTFRQERTDITFEPEENIQGKLIVINQKVVTRVTTIDNSVGRQDSREEKQSEYGKYHLYQPIVLLGYEPDLDLTLPSVEPIPAFLFYYAVDYDKIKDFDAGILFTVEVILEVGLFFMTGGLSSLRHIRHLRHVTKLFKVKNAYSTMAATEKVLFWRGLEGTAEITSASAAVMNSYFTYSATTSNDADIIELNNKIGSFFLIMTLVSAGGAVTSRYRCVKSADEVLAKIDELTGLGKAHTIPQEVLDVIYVVRNTGTVSKTLFRNYVQDVAGMNARLTGTNHITSLFANFTDDVKDAFWKHFGNFADESADSIDFWNKMNKAEGGVSAARMKAWKNCDPSLRHIRRELNVLDAIVHIRHNSPELNTEIFSGVVGKKLKDDAVPPYSNSSYRWIAKGVHYKSALTAQGGFAQIVGNIFPKPYGYYKAKVRMYNAELFNLDPNTGGWITKKSQGGMSSFFPNSWSPEKVQEMIAVAYYRRKFKTGNIWVGSELNGVKIKFHIDDFGVIKSAYPDI